MGIIYKGIIYLLANVIPKDRSVWVFGAWFGEKYSDNSKSFFEYVNKHCPDKKSIWVSKSSHIINELKEKGYRAYHMHSIAGIYYQLRASFAFVCQAHDVDLFAPTLGKNTKVVNLWHGLPLKKIVYDEFGHIEKKRNLKGRIIDFLTPYDHMRNDFLIATNERTQHTIAGAFRLPLNKVLITGFPRNDVFINPAPEAQPTPTYKVIYMPTMRKQVNGSNALFEDFGFDVDTIERELSKHNIELVLRLHPVNKAPAALQQKIGTSKNICFDFSDDIYESITSYDCLVTDYSSIYFDFLLSNKPILFAPFDLSNYKAKERELYYDYEDVTLTPYSFNWTELINNIISLKRNTSDSHYISQYKELSEIFHQPDLKNNFSQVLLKTIENL